MVVYSRVGGGHVAAAKALAEALEVAGSSVRLVDAYVDRGRFPVTWFPRMYAELARHHPWLWGLIYSGTSRDLNPAPVIGPFLRDGFRRLMEDEQPDVVISVIPAVNGLLATAAKVVGARLEVVLTDWSSVHPFWVAPGVDHYTASTPLSRDDCIRFGAPPSAVDVVGIPVRREFALTSNQANHRKAKESLSRLGLDPSRFTVLAMVGAEGSPKSFANIMRLATTNLDAQLVVVCGRNEKLRRRVARIPSRITVRALGFVENVAELMRASDVLITKAGGLTFAEAFCAGVPVVVYDVLRGQEAGNLEYVLDHGAVEYAANPRRLVQIVAALEADPLQRAALAGCGARLARPEAAGLIARSVLARLDAARPELCGYREAE